MAEKRRKSTLESLGLPTVWWHGTTQQFRSLSPAHNMPGVIWLADFNTAREYADKSYVPAERKAMIEVELDPNMRVLDLTDPDEPFVDELVELINEAASGRGFGWRRTKAEWLANKYQYGELETYPFIIRLLKSRRVQGILVNDVAGWGGHESAKTLALLSKSSIVRETRHSLADLEARPNPPAASERETRHQTSVEAAHELADIINAQRGAPRANAWAPTTAGVAPRVYIVGAGYLTLSGVEVHGLAAIPGLRSARVTLKLGELYPAERKALRAALDVYSQAYALPKLHELDQASEHDFEATRAAVLVAIASGASTRREIAAVTGLLVPELTRILNALETDGDVYIRARGTAAEKILG